MGLFLSEEEYRKLVSLQYQLDEEEGDEDKVWIPSISPAKERMERKLKSNNVIDLSSSDLTLERVREGIANCSGVRINRFTIKINLKYGDGGVSQCLDNMDDLRFNIMIYEGEKNNPGLLVKINPNKDKRFEQAEWLKYFIFNGGRGSSFSEWGREIPINMMINICLWMQKIERLKLFW